MEKRIIVEGKKQSDKSMIISILVIFLSFCIATYTYHNCTGVRYTRGFFANRVYCDYYDVIYDTFIEFFFKEFFAEGHGYICIVGIIGTIASSMINKNIKKCEITVTDEEIYGKVANGKKVSIPLNQIIAVKPCILKGISIKYVGNTSNFYCIKNRDEVLKTITYLLENSAQISREKAIGGVEQLKSLKSLLDANIITQEEFEMKKKEII